MWIQAVGDWFVGLHRDERHGFLANRREVEWRLHPFQLEHKFDTLAAVADGLHAMSSLGWSTRIELTDAGVESVCERLWSNPAAAGLSRNGARVVRLGDQGWLTCYSTDSGLALWDSELGRGTVDAIGCIGTDFVILHSRRLAACWSLTEGRELWRLEDHRASDLLFAFDSDCERLLTLREEKELTLFDPVTDTQLDAILGGTVTGIEFLSLARVLVAGYSAEGAFLRVINIEVSAEVVWECKFKESSSSPTLHKLTDESVLYWIRGVECGRIATRPELVCEVWPVASPVDVRVVADGCLVMDEFDQVTFFGDRGQPQWSIPAPPGGLAAVQGAPERWSVAGRSGVLFDSLEGTRTRPVVWPCLHDERHDTPRHFVDWEHQLFVYLADCQLGQIRELESGNIVLSLGAETTNRPPESWIGFARVENETAWFTASGRSGRGGYGVLDGTHRMNRWPLFRPSSLRRTHETLVELRDSKGGFSVHDIESHEERAAFRGFEDGSFLASTGGKRFNTSGAASRFFETQN